MIKSIVFKHIELMSVCQSHSFELMVSLTNLVRFYSFVVANVFVGRNAYNLLMIDPALYGRFESSTG